LAGGETGPLKRILRLLLFLGALLVGGTLGFARLEGLSFLDALYLTGETLSTVGYGNVAPETPRGRLFSILLMIGGASAALSAAGLLVGYIVEGRLAAQFGRRREMRALEKTRDHIILCGYGQVGRRVARILHGTGTSFVVVERDATAAREAREEGCLLVEGDATEEEVLEAAGLHRARGMLTTIGDDAENLYICMTARALRPELPIVSRVTTERAAANIRRAGISQVIFPVEMAARRMVQSLLRPEVVDFLDLVLGPGARGPGLEAYRIPEACRLVGKKLREAGLREEFGLHVIAIRRDGNYLPSPGPEEVLRAGDALILVGTEETFARFRDAMAVEMEG
jgi:voltage-gated potassium channel